MSKKNIFGQLVPIDACSAPLIDYGEVEQEFEAECEFAYNFEDCHHLTFYKKGEFKGHSKCKLK